MLSRQKKSFLVFWQKARKLPDRKPSGRTHVFFQILADKSGVFNVFNKFATSFQHLADSNTTFNWFQDISLYELVPAMLGHCFYSQHSRTGVF